VGDVGAPSPAACDDVRATLLAVLIADVGGSGDAKAVPRMIEGVDPDGHCHVADDVQAILGRPDALGAWPHKEGGRAAFGAGHRARSALCIDP
jgi:hypothetical protein